MLPILLTQVIQAARLAQVTPQMVWTVRAALLALMVLPMKVARVTLASKGNVDGVCGAGGTECTGDTDGADTGRKGGSCGANCAANSGGASCVGGTIDGGL